jgi:adenosylmethionine-8-amino-7-oxononanoate aminotransferase
MGTKDGILGDVVLICPAYNSTEDDIRHIVNKVKQTVDWTFKDLEKNDSSLFRAQPASKL